MQSDSNDGLCTHVSDRVDGDVLEHTTVHENHVPHPDRRVDAGQRHGGAHCDWQRAIGKHYGFATHKIGRHTPKGCRQLIEIGNIGVSQRRTVEEQRQGLALIETSGKREWTATTPQFGPDSIFFQCPSTRTPRVPNRRQPPSTDDFISITNTTTFFSLAQFLPLPIPKTFLLSNRNRAPPLTI